MGQPEWDSQNGTGRMEWAEDGMQNGTARTELPVQTASTGLPELDSQDRTAKTKLQCRTARTLLPGLECQDRTVRAVTAMI